AGGRGRQPAPVWGGSAPGRGGGGRGAPSDGRGPPARAPRPRRPPPMVLIGGSTEKAARHAARLRAGFFPAVADPALAAAYEEECARQGFTGFVAMPGGPGFVHVTDDPERDWARIAPHAL